MTSLSQLGSSLTDSIRSEAGVDLLATVGDIGVDAAISSGALDGIPIFGVVTGIWKAGKHVQQELFVRKVLRFLGEATKASPDEKQRFHERLERRGKVDEFGETILLILERLDDVVKPGLVGRVLAAHLQGKIDYENAMRLASIISRCYSSDLEYLKTFQPGVQGDKTPIAESLVAAGLLSNAGIDGGTAQPGSGGIIFVINEYGEMLLEYALRYAVPEGSTRK